MSLRDSIYHTSSSRLSSMPKTLPAAATPASSPNTAKTSSRQETEDKAKGLVTKTLAAIGRSNGANMPYGAGTTIGSAGVAALTLGRVAYDDGPIQVMGETTFLEARARTYHTKTGFGAEAQAGLFRSEYGFKSNLPLAQTSGGHELLGFGVEAKAEVFVGAQVNTYAGAGTKNGIPVAEASVSAFVGARAGIFSAAEVRVAGIGMRVNASAQAWAGAQGSASVTASPTGLSAEVEGFAGAEANVSASASIGGIGISAEGDAYAGVGGKAGISIGYKDGDIKIEAELGGAFGVGVGTELGASINLDQLLGDGAAFLGTASDLLNNGTQSAGDAANSAGQEVKDAVDAAAQAATQAVDAVMDFFGF